jgi:hypothetical protein
VANNSIALAAIRVYNLLRVNPDIPDQGFQRELSDRVENGGVWVIWTPRSHRLVQNQGLSGSKIHSVGARQVIAPVKTVFQAILKRYPAKIPTKVTPCRIRIQGQGQVKPRNRLKAALTL